MLLPLLAIKRSFNYQFGAKLRKLFASTLPQGNERRQPPEGLVPGPRVVADTLAARERGRASGGRPLQ